MSEEGRGLGFFKGTMVFVGEVRAEVLKITWPGRDELKRATLVILAFCAFMTVLIGILDLILQAILVTLPGRIA